MTDEEYINMITAEKEYIDCLCGGRAELTQDKSPCDEYMYYYEATCQKCGKYAAGYTSESVHKNMNRGRYKS